MSYKNSIKNYNVNGFVVLKNVFSQKDIKKILQDLENTTQLLKKTKDRKFFHKTKNHTEIPTPPCCASDLFENCYESFRLCLSRAWLTRVESACSLSYAMPKQISDIRDFLQKARRKDARSVRGALRGAVALTHHLREVWLYLYTTLHHDV